MASRPYNGFPAEFRSKRGSQVYRLMKAGKLKRPDTCVMCKKTANDNPLNVQAHTEDYHSQTAFVGLCPPCHSAVHARFRDIRTWHKWRDAVASGWQPPRTRDYRVFRQIWDSFKQEPIGPIDRTNWAFTLQDQEPDLYTGRVSTYYQPEDGLFSL